MLSRVAERVYWQARYLERAENTARLLNVFSTLLLDLPPRTKLGWRSLVEITGASAAFDSRYKQMTERTVMRFLLHENNGFSILDMLSQARENARTTREVMPAEAFEQINNLYYFAKENVAKAVSRGPRHELLTEIIANCQQISGLMGGTMSRDDAFNFIRLGRNLERADMTTRIVDVGSGNLLPSLSGIAGEKGFVEPYEDVLWMNILRSLSAYQMYRQHVKDRINAEDVVIFLLQDAQFPRAVCYCLSQLLKILDALPNNSSVSAQVSKTLRFVQRAKIDELLEHGLLQHIDDLQVSIATIHHRIAGTWFLPNK